MQKIEIEKILQDLIKPIFSFTLKKCKTLEDAEDLSQDIILKAYTSLLNNESINDPKKYIWTIAHNLLVNYYKDNSKTIYGKIDDINLIVDTDNIFEDDERIKSLQQEIAYLSKNRRQIIIKYYYENKTQQEISNELNLPLGTIKWHLFEAKKELKEGIKTMRQTSELKFNPVEFKFIGLSGSSGTIDPGEFFRSSLSQNICYATYYTPKTINDIASDLGVSPVYIESEIEYLEKYDFLRKVNNKYLVNFLINEPTTEILKKQHEVYQQAASSFSIDLYNELINSKLLDDENLICNKINENNTTKRNYNFILWSLIPYIISNSGNPILEEKVKFEEVATHRLDGSYAYFSVDVLNNDLKYPENFVSMNNWCGPMWNSVKGHILWEIHSDYTDKEKFNGFVYQSDAVKVLELFLKEKEYPLSMEEYSWLAEKGYVKIKGHIDELFYSSWQNVIINSSELQQKLLEIGKNVKNKYHDLFIELKNEFQNILFKNTPKHLRKMREYETQYLFSSNGLFINHVLVNLINNHKLILPTKEESKSLISLILTDNHN